MPRLGRKRIVGDCASTGCFHSALRCTAQAFALLSSHHGGMPFFSHSGRFRLIRKSMARFCSLDCLRDGCLYCGSYLCSQERIHWRGHCYLAMFIHRGPDRALFSVEQWSFFLDGANGFACIAGLGCLVSSIHPAFSECSNFQNGLRPAGRHPFGGFDFDCWNGFRVGGSHGNAIFGSLVFPAIYSCHLICLKITLTSQFRNSSFSALESNSDSFNRTLTM